MNNVILNSLILNRSEARTTLHSSFLILHLLYSPGAAHILAVLLVLHLAPHRGRSELSGGTAAQRAALDVNPRIEIRCSLGSLRSESHAEDGEVVNLHVLPLEQNLLDTVHHVAEHTLDAALGIRRVVLGHVLGELVDADGLVSYGTCIPFLVVCTGLDAVLKLL